MFATHLKYATTGPKKMQVMGSLVQGQHVNDAVQSLHFLPHKSAGILKKLIKTAVNNAKQAGYTESSLYVESVQVGRSPYLKRVRPVSRGRGHRYKRQRSYVKVVLSTV